MVKLVNMSTYDQDLKRFNYSSKTMSSFLRKCELDGIEMLNPIMWKEESIPQKEIKGVHLKYYPIWLDFWKENKEEVLRQFKTMDKAKQYYGGTTRKAIIEHYKKEIEIATEIKAEYVVFHVSHIELEHAYNYNFTYSDSEVIDATIELVNEIFKDLDTDIMLLFENLWWPGLTLLDKKMVLRLFEGVKYRNKGIMLDTAHLMNTNLYLKDEREGIEYLVKTIENLGELKYLIKGIHLNSSLSGGYVLKEITRNRLEKPTFEEMNSNILKHIINIDCHKPFHHKDIVKVINMVNPQYVVYEFITSSVEQLEEYIAIQHRATNKNQL